MAALLYATVGGESVRQAINDTPLSEGRFFHVFVIRAVAPGSDAVFQVLFALEDRNGGVGHHKVTFAAVRLFHGDLEIAAAAGGIQVIDFKCTRRNGILINHVAVLTHHHQRITVGRAADDRGIAFFAVRQHIVVGV